MDRDTIIARARKKVGEPTSGGYWSDNSQWEDAVQDAQEAFAIKARPLKSCATTTLTQGTAEYDLSESSLADFLDITEVWYFTSTTNYRKLKPVSRDELTAIQGEMRDQQNYPTVYCFEDRKIEFDTAAPAADTLKIYYLELPDAMTAGSNVPEIHTKYHQALVYHVAWQFMESENAESTDTIYFKAMYEEKVMEALTFIQKQGETYPYIKQDDWEADIYV